MFCIVLSCILAKFMISFVTFMIDIFRQQTCSDKIVQMFEIQDFAVTWLSVRSCKIQ